MIAAIRDYFLNRFKFRCRDCGEWKKLRYMEGRGAICFQCFVPSMNRQEKRRILRYAEKRNAKGG